MGKREQKGLASRCVAGPGRSWLNGRVLRSHTIPLGNCNSRCDSPASEALSLPLSPPLPLLTRGSKSKGTGTDGHATGDTVKGESSFLSQFKRL